jgi:translation initiation factor IF-2
MIKYRIHEVAKDFNVPSKMVLELLSKYFSDVKNHMTALNQEELNIVFEHFTQNNSVESLEKFFQEADIAAAQGKEKKVKSEGLGEKKQEEKPSETQQGQSQSAVEPGTKKVRIVDTKAVSVDLAKFDERIETLVPEKTEKVIEQTDRQKQKIKRGSNRGHQNSRHLEAERQKKLALEKARRQALEITIPEEISVGELALRLKITATEIIKKLMGLGVMASVSQVIDYDTAALVAEEIGAKVEKEVVVTIEDRLFDESEDEEKDLVERSPVVVVMGHVDHGKTSLLDAIRNANVVSGEAGGITQHIGAYRVQIHGQDITFLDTPGHEAFTAMRARGAQVTDIAILVVAADDGIMPQTIEAINHAKAAGVNIIVAINKIDKEGANPERVMQELTEYELIPEEWGGETICVPVSALKKTGIEQLLEMVLLVAEMKELKANPNRMAKGTVIESKLDKGRGPVATVLVQNGTLKLGDAIIAGTAVGRIRAMSDDKGKKVQKAGPSVPVEIVGLAEVPDGGDVFYAVKDERMARELVEQRKQKAKDEQYKSSRSKISLDDLFSQMKEGEVKELNIIVKADVQGSVEAVRQALEKLSNDEVKVRCIHGSVGAIRESDVMLASASQAIIVGFNVRPDPGARVSAEMQEVDLRTYRIIYEAIDEISLAMKGLLAPKFKEVVLGHAQIRQTFKVSGVGTIAGCYMQDGKITRNCSVRVVRDGIVVHEGVLASLKRFKDDVKEVAEGYECGMSVEKFNDIKEGDIIEGYAMEEIKQ